MRALLRSQTLFLQSKHRIAATDASTHHYAIDLGHDMLRCDPNTELLELCVSSFGTTLNWKACDETNNAVRYTCLRTNVATDVVLKPGNFTNKQLALALSVQGVCSCLYLPQPNHLVWTFTEPYRLTFLADPTRTGRLFGLPTNVDLTGTQIESTQPINPPPVSNLCLHVEGVTPYRACNAATDASTRKLERSALLLAIPVTAPPFVEFAYRNINDDYAMFIAESQLSRLSVRFTDFDNAPLAVLGEHHLTLRVKTYARDPHALERKLDELTRLTRLSLLDHSTRVGVQPRPEVADLV